MAARLWPNGRCPAELRFAPVEADPLGAYRIPRLRIAQAAHHGGAKASASVRGARWSVSGRWERTSVDTSREFSMVYLFRVAVLN